MTNEITLLSITAASIGFFHTLFGPDHYLPFIMMARANRWSLVKTTWITVLCGIGHVGSSIVLGIFGITFGVALSKLEFLESFRGNIAAWLLIGFGLIYFVWGLRQGIKNKSHSHLHSHRHGTYHNHEHRHDGEHTHVHESDRNQNLTPWILFTIFVLGPCEPFIPILMYPAAKSNVWGIVVVSLIFGIFTILTMTGIVIIALLGVNLLPFKKMERYVHALAGAIIFLSGLGIQFLGL